MNKYIQAILSFLFIFSMPFIIHQGMLLYKEPLNFIENPMVWFVIVFFAFVVLMKEITFFSAMEKAKRLQMEKDGLVYEKPEFFGWYKRLITYWTAAKPKEEVEIILDHNYDGIRELDNNLPPWWKNLFYISIVFAVVYLTRYHIFDGDTQIDEYHQQLAEAKRELEIYKLKTPDAFDFDNVTLLTDEKDLIKGKAVFNQNCIACHSIDGGGGIGPNLTDDYWILGGGFKNVIHTLLNGGRDGKGMIAWDKTLKPEEIVKVGSYVISLNGTKPLNPKEPQGELWVKEVKDTLQIDTVKVLLEKQKVIIKANEE